MGRTGWVTSWVRLGTVRDRWPGGSGAWLAGNVPGYQGSDWDTYLLFGPEATWTSQPTPLRSSGAPVFDRIGQLSQALDPLLTAPRRAG